MKKVNADILAEVSGADGFSDFPQGKKNNWINLQYSSICNLYCNVHIKSTRTKHMQLTGV